MEGAINGLQIASCIVRNELDELCPHFKLKRFINKSLKKVKLDKLNLDKELNKLKEAEKEVEYVLYRPFLNDPNLALLYLLESPNCTELLELLSASDTHTKTRALSMLLFILEKRVYGSNLIFNPFRETDKELNLAKTILNLFSRSIDSIFVNDDVIINYSLRLIFECVKRLRTDHLNRFLAAFNLFKYLTKCHVTTHPDVNFTILHVFLSYFKQDSDPGGPDDHHHSDDAMHLSLRRTLKLLKAFLSAEFEKSGQPCPLGHSFPTIEPASSGTSGTQSASTTEAAEPEPNQKLDLYYTNGKLKLSIILLLGIKRVRLQRELLGLVFSHFKHEQPATQIAVTHLSLCYLSNCFQTHSNEPSERKMLDFLVANINGCLLLFQKLSSALPKPKSNEPESDASAHSPAEPKPDCLTRLAKCIFNEFVLILNHNVEDAAILNLLSKYELPFVATELDQLYKTNANVYKLYVSQISSASNHTLFVDIMVRFLDRGFELPASVTKNMLNSFLSCKSLPLLNNVFKLFIKILNQNKSEGVLPDIKTIINLNPTAIKSEPGDVQLELDSIANWLELLYRSNSASSKSVYDPLKLFKIPQIAENYTLVSGHLLGFFRGRSAEHFDRELVGLAQQHGSAPLAPEEAERRLAVDLNLISCTFHLGINDSLVMSNLHYRYFKILLGRYLLTNAICTYHSEPPAGSPEASSGSAPLLSENKPLQLYNGTLRHYLKLILANVISVSNTHNGNQPDQPTSSGSERPVPMGREIEAYLANVDSLFLANVVLIMYNTILKNNIQLLYPLKGVRGFQTMGVFVQQYKCLNCILSEYLHCNVYLKLLFQVLLQVSKQPDVFDGTLKYYTCSSCSHYYTNFVGLFDARYAELRLLPAELVSFNEAGAPTEKEKSKLLSGERLESFKQYVNKILVHYVRDPETREYFKMQLFNLVNHLQSPLDYFTSPDKASAAPKPSENGRLEAYRLLAQKLFRVGSESFSKQTSLNSTASADSTKRHAGSARSKNAGTNSIKFITISNDTVLNEVSLSYGGLSIAKNEPPNSTGNPSLDHEPQGSIDPSNASEHPDLGSQARIGALLTHINAIMGRLDTVTDAADQHTMLDYVYYYTVRLIEADESYKRLKTIIRPHRESSYELGLLCDFAMNKHKTLCRLFTNLMSGLISPATPTSKGDSKDGHTGNNAHTSPDNNDMAVDAANQVKNDNTAINNDTSKDSNRKLIMLLILINNNKELEELVVNNRQTLKLLAANLERLGDCQNGCSFFNCNLTLLYFLLELLNSYLRSKFKSAPDAKADREFEPTFDSQLDSKIDEEKNNKKHRRQMAEVLYSDWFLDTCERVLSGRYYYLGYAIETKLYLGVLKILHFLFFSLSRDDTRKLDKERMKRVLRRYYALCKHNYKCTNGSDDVLIKLILFKIIRLSNTLEKRPGRTRKTGAFSELEFYLKLANINHFKLVHYSPTVFGSSLHSSEAPDEHCTEDSNKECHGCLNGWPIYNRALVFKTSKGGDLGQLRLNLTLYSHSREDQLVRVGSDVGSNSLGPEHIQRLQLAHRLRHLTRLQLGAGSAQPDGLTHVEQLLDRGCCELYAGLGEEAINANLSSPSASSRAPSPAGCEDFLVASLESSNAHYYEGVVQALSAHGPQPRARSLAEEDLLISQLLALGSRLDSPEQLNSAEILSSLLMPDYYKYDLDYLIGYVYKLLLIQCYSQIAAAPASADAPTSPPDGPAATAGTDATAQSNPPKKYFEFDAVHINMSNLVKLVLSRLVFKKDEPLVGQIVKLLNRLNTNAELRYVLYHVRKNADAEELIHIISLFNTLGTSRDKRQVELDRRGTELDRLLLRSNLTGLGPEGQRELLARVGRALLHSLLSGEAQLFKVAGLLHNLRRSNARLFRELHVPSYVAALRSSHCLSAQDRLFVNLLSRLIC